MVAPEVSTEHHRSAAVDAQQAGSERTLITVKAYTRHNRNCPKRDRSDWARCNCVKWLYIYRDGKYKLVSAKTRSWERAEQKARAKSGTPLIQSNSCSVNSKPNHKIANRNWT